MIKPTIGTYTIYTKSDCIFCDKVKELLKNEKIVIVSCDEMLKNDEKKKHFLEIMDIFTMKVNMKPHRTFPFVFKDDQFIGGFDDTKNVSNKLRSGWEFVRADEYPGENFSTITEGKYTGVIGHGGLALARIPIEIANARNAYFAKKTKEREDAVNNDAYKDQHPSMPINSERQTRVTFGGTNKK